MLKQSGIGAVAAFVLMWTASGAWAFDHTHAALDAVLKSVVKGDRVDYASLAADHARLDEYIAAIGAVAPAEFDGWTAAQQKAAWINAYNAFTLQSIVEKYPVKSIRDIDGVWKTRAWTVAGRAITLDDIEHRRLRLLGDARVHAAINCASVGCPPLADFAFSADTLDAQLDRAARAWVNNVQQNRVENGVAEINEIFSWFGDDFVPKYHRDGRFPGLSISESAAIGFLYAFGSATLKSAIDNGVSRVTYRPYDWNLNGK